MPVFLKRTIWGWMFGIPGVVYMVLAVTGRPAWVPVELQYYLFIPFVLGLTVLTWGALRPRWRLRNIYTGEETDAETAYDAHRAEAKALAVAARRTSAPPIPDNVDRDAFGFPIKDDEDADDDEEGDDNVAVARVTFADSGQIGPREGVMGHVYRAIMTLAAVMMWLVVIEGLVQGGKWARERGLWYVSAPSFALIAAMVWYGSQRRDGAAKSDAAKAAAAPVIVQGGADDLVR